jgi:hypothetical protein
VPLPPALPADQWERQLRLTTEVITLTKPDTALARRPGSGLPLIRSILDTVPTAEDDPTPRMMEYILNADSAQDWEALFESLSFKNMTGETVRVHTIRWAPSRFENSLTGIFLICDITVLKTGEQDVMTVGGDLAIAQLLNCWSRQDFPHDFEVVRKETATAAGFHPMRLRSLGKVVREASEAS